MVARTGANSANAGGSGASASSTAAPAFSKSGESGESGERGTLGEMGLLERGRGIQQGAQDVGHGEDVVGKGEERTGRISGPPQEDGKGGNSSNTDDPVVTLSQLARVELTPIVNMSFLEYENIEPSVQSPQKAFESPKPIHNLDDYALRMRTFCPHTQYFL